MSCLWGWIKAKHFHIGLRQKHVLESIINNTHHPQRFLTRAGNLSCFQLHTRAMFSDLDAELDTKAKVWCTSIELWNVAWETGPWGSKIGCFNGCLCYLTQHTYNRDKPQPCWCSSTITYLASSANKPVTWEHFLQHLSTILLPFKQFWKSESFLNCKSTPLTSIIANAKQ